MSKSVAAPQSYKQPSRKGKKAWRKNVDISEVQKGLEELREEIIQGGPISEKPSDELFALDTAGSETIQKAYNKVHKPLKADEILAQRSAVPEIEHRKRPANSRVTDGILEPSSKRQKANWVSKKDVQRLKQVAARNGVGALAPEQLNGGVEASNFDLWANVEPEHDQTAPSEYIPKRRPKVAPQSIRQKPISQTATGQAVTALPNPKGGMSYNPDFEDWDKLLDEEGRKAVEAEKERLEAERKAAELQDRVNAAGLQAENAYDDETDWEGFESEYEKPEHLKKKRPERKTPSQRNKATRRKEAERLSKHAARMAKTEERLAKMEEAENRETGLESTDQPQSDAKEGDDDLKLRRRKFGNIAIPQKRLEVVLPDELQDSLRRLRPEGNLLDDRFRNILVNGKLEARKPVHGGKKKKVKVTEKWSYKDFDVRA